MDPETLKQAGRFYKCIIFQLLWLALIILIAVTGITQTNHTAKIFVKYFAFAYAIFLFLMLIYFVIIKRIFINELMNYMAVTTKPLPFFAKRSIEQNIKIGRIFSYCCMAIFAIINYFADIVAWNIFLWFVGMVITIDIIFYVVGFYKVLKNKIEK